MHALVVIAVILACGLFFICVAFIARVLIPALRGHQRDLLAVEEARLDKKASVWRIRTPEGKRWNAGPFEFPPLHRWARFTRDMDNRGWTPYTAAALLSDSKVWTAGVGWHIERPVSWEEWHHVTGLHDWLDLLDGDEGLVQACLAAGQTYATVASALLDGTFDEAAIRTLAALRTP